MDNDPTDFEPTPVIDDQPPHSNIATPSTHHKTKLFVSLSVIALLVLAGGAAAYWFTNHRGAAAQTGLATPPSASSSSDQPTVPSGTQAPGTPTRYVSNGKDLNLSFSYPTSWTVTPPSNNNPNDQTITVTSPAVSMPSTNGQSVNGKVVVSIRPGGTTLDELASNHATAGQASAQIGYDKPTPAQHQYPYLTYLHLAGGANPNSTFEEVIITGGSSFAKDQVILAADLSLLDPIVSARFYTCSNQTCATTNSAALSITNSTWLNTDVCTQTLALFQSLEIN